jgi:hypothetical protein
MLGQSRRLADAVYGGQSRRRPPSSSGLGHRPFKAAARVRIPLGARADGTVLGPGSVRVRKRSRPWPRCAGGSRAADRHRAEHLLVEVDRDADAAPGKFIPSGVRTRCFTRRRPDQAAGSPGRGPSGSAAAEGHHLVSTGVIGHFCWVGGRSNACRQASAAWCSQRPRAHQRYAWSGRLASSLIPNGSADSPWSPGPAGAFLARDPAATPPAAQPRRLASASSAAKLLRPSAVIGCPVLFACLTTGPPVVCSSGRRRLPFAVPITGTRRLRLAVRGPVEQLGVLATLSRWRSRVQIPSGPHGSPVRFTGVPARSGSSVGMSVRLKSGRSAVRPCP